MKLQRDISSAEEENCDHIPFVSLESLKKLITPQAVDSHLKARGIRSSPETIQIIVSKAPKLFAILVLTEQEHHVLYLLQNGFNDDRFPMPEAEVPEFESSQQRKIFYWTQWRFSLSLKKEKHLELPGNVPLPFISEKPTAFGAFGIVSKVKISPGHLPEHKSNYAAMKTIRARRNYGWDTLMREVDTLRRRQHNNIVSLLASFTINAFGSEERSLRILFPWADMNMVQWLNLDSTPLEGMPRRNDQRNWLYHEIYALVSAISYLHRDIDGTMTSHHDLKPENILWLEGSLKICDLGRSHLFTLTEGSETEGRSGLGTFTYQPPEYYNEDGSRSSRKHGRAFDVWSFGCIIVEMAILIVHGWDGQKVNEFAKARETGRGRRRDFSKVRDFDDSFHNNMNVVGQWILELKQGESQRLVQTLSIAEKMLTKNPEERLYSWEAELDLYEMLYPDDHSIARMEKVGVCVQRPNMRNIGRAQNPLHRAALTGNRDRVAKLLESGWPTDAQDGSGLTPIQLARNGGHTAVESLLFYHRSHGGEYESLPREANQRTAPLDSDLLARDRLGKTALHRAAEFGRIREFQEILKRAKRPETLLEDQDGNGLTPLHWAAKSGCFEIVALIFNFGVAESSIWNEDNSGKTPLHHSAEKGAQQIVHILLRRNQCPENLILWKDRDNRIPLHWAAQGGHLNVVELLLDLEEFVDPSICEPSIYRMLSATDSGGKTPLDLAISNKQDAVVDRLRRTASSGV